ncbi:MAG: hypothetical protein ACFFDT_08180 [Candidatus Hodarchaeota archaeon]
MTLSDFSLSNFISVAGAFLIAIILFFLSNANQLILPFITFNIHIAPYNQLIPYDSFFLPVASSLAFFATIVCLMILMDLNSPERRVSNIYFPLSSILTFLLVLELLGFILLVLTQ